MMEAVYSDGAAPTESPHSQQNLPSEIPGPIHLPFGDTVCAQVAESEFSATFENLDAVSTSPEGAVDYRSAIVRYYRAYRERDRDTLESLLTRDVHFISSFGEHRDRDAMLDEIWPAVGITWATRVRIFGEGPEFVVLYEHANTPGLERPPMSMAEYIRFEGDNISVVEVFTGRARE